MKICYNLPKNHSNDPNSTKGVKNGSVNFFPSLSSLESVPWGGNSIMQTASKIEDKVEGFLFLSLNRELYPPNWQLLHPIFYCTGGAIAQWSQYKVSNLIFLQAIPNYLVLFWSVYKKTSQFIIPIHSFKLIDTNVLLKHSVLWGDEESWNCASMSTAQLVRLLLNTPILSAMQAGCAFKQAWARAAGGMGSTGQLGSWWGQQCCSL